MKLLFIIIGLLVLGGCASTLSEKMNTQIGVMTVQDAITRWGTPASQRKTDDGGTMMVWTPKSSAISRPQYVAPRGPTYGGTANGGQEQGDTLVVRFDRRGLMEQWNYERR
jgi:uncharacterized protein YceK